MIEQCPLFADVHILDDAAPPELDEADFVAEGGEADGGDEQQEKQVKKQISARK